MYSINYTKKDTKFCLSLHYNGANSYLFVNGTEIIKFKAKDSEIKAYSLCLENISKDWSNDLMDLILFNKQDLMVIFIILVQIIVLLMLIILKIYINI